MSREAIELSVERSKSTGKVRFKRMHRGKLWKSTVYETDSRRNRQRAWELFVAWREQRDQQLDEQAATQRVTAMETGTPTEVAGHRLFTRFARGLSDYAELTGDDASRLEWEQLSKQAESATEEQNKQLLQDDLFRLMPRATTRQGRPPTHPPLLFTPTSRRDNFRQV